MNDHPFTQKDFLARLEQLYADNVEISRRKNSDYANDQDPLQNFRVCEALGIPAEIGLIVRMSDKLMRVTNLVKPGRETMVKDESVLDTLSDLANYAMILRILLEQKGIEGTNCGFDHNRGAVDIEVEGKKIVIP